MSKFTLGFINKVMVPVADTLAMTSNGYCAFLQGGSATMQLKVNEIYVGGESAASNPTTIALGRDTTVAVTAITATNIQNALQDASATAPGTLATFGGGATTNPQRSATAGRLAVPTLNAYGAIARIQWRFGEEITTIGLAQPLGELSLSAFAGTGQVSGHIFYDLV